MRQLSKSKTRLRFVTEDIVRYRGRYRRIVVEVNQDCTTMDLRLEGSRTRLPISFGGAWNLANKIAVEKERTDRKARRSAR